MNCGDKLKSRLVCNMCKEKRGEGGIKGGGELPNAYGTFAWFDNLSKFSSQSKFFHEYCDN